MFVLFVVSIVAGESYEPGLRYIAYGLAILLVPGLSFVLYLARKRDWRFFRHPILRSMSFLLIRLLLATCLLPAFTFLISNRTIIRYLTALGWYQNRSFFTYGGYALLILQVLTFLIYSWLAHLKKRTEHLWVPLAIWVIILISPLAFASWSDAARAQKPDEGVSQAATIRYCINVKSSANWKTCVNRTLRTEADYRFCDSNASVMLAVQEKEVNINDATSYCQVTWAIASHDLKVCSMLSSISQDECENALLKRQTPASAASLCAQFSWHQPIFQCYQQSKEYFAAHPAEFKTFCQHVKDKFIVLSIQTVDQYRDFGIACGFFSSSSTEKPIISDIAIPSLYGSVEIQWVTQVNADSTVSYGLTGRYDLKSTRWPSSISGLNLPYIAGTHRILLDVKSGQTYHYSIQSCTAPPNSLCTTTPDAMFVAQ
ncbi:MAG: hypothetical protein HY092_02755 [Candidatus Kerfeldbacteria bacterium]|nr:hypothetical protein [Candidatus Kerfeldbacteria bacterium]